MSTQRLIGFVVGGVLMAGAIVAVVFLRTSPPQQEEPELLRPLKTLTVQDAYAGVVRVYPGKVRASQEVDLSFNVAGQLTELNVKAGDRVKRGDLIARLDPRDFEQDVAAARADLIEKTSKFTKIEQAYEAEAATQKEVIEARALRDKAAATLKISEKAFEDTQLRAPFDGAIARRFVDNFKRVEVKEDIVSLQDVTVVEIEVNIPEARVAMLRDTGVVRAQLKVSFDFLPGRMFDVEVEEFDVAADPTTQTYSARVSMPAPEDVSIFPGMTATLHETFQSDDAATSFLLPLGVVPVDSDGTYFVWKIQDGASGVASVHKTPVQVGELTGSRVAITAGLSEGDRVAAAGVHQLREGQQVQPFDAKAKGAGQL